MQYGRPAGLDVDVSKLILGCDNKLTMEEGAPIWDAFLACGGTTFDTAHIYQNGACERALGAWLKHAGVADRTVVVVKGAHTPNCNPEALVAQLHESLDRLQLPRAPIFIMHRDNADVPVDEFVDVLNAQVDAGLVTVFGGSNWTVGRMQAANDYAARSGKQGFAILNNNLSLAHMQRPVWDGCISSSDDATLAFLTETQMTHFSWSSQARGYFYQDAGAMAALPEGTRPDDCFDSADNRERRRRAAALASRFGVEAAHVAAAYVLCQPFPSYALIGPRSIDELNDSMAAFKVELAQQHLDWLNLKHDEMPDGAA